MRQGARLGLTAATALAQLIGGGCKRGPTGPAAEKAARDAAVSVVRHLAAGDLAAVVARFDEKMRKALPEARLVQAWASLGTPTTAPRQVTVVKAGRMAGHHVVLVRADYQNAAALARLVLDDQLRVAGLYLRRGNAPVRTTPPPRESGLRERLVTVGSGTFAVTGTWTIPRGKPPFPAVVLVHGSGPHDRDETIGPNKPFRDIAWGLAVKGVAVLRYDKRSRVHGAKLPADVGVREVVEDDALAALAVARAQPEADPTRVFLLGHSLGGMLAPRIAGRDPKVAGVILLAANDRPLEDLILDQVQYILGVKGVPAAQRRAQMTALRAQVRRARRPDLSNATPREKLPLGIPASFWRSLRGYHPAATAKGLRIPILVLQGGRDYQVTTVDFARWRRALAGRDGAVLRLYPNLNHLFHGGRGKATPAEYKRPGKVAQAVIDDIARFVRRGPKAMGEASGTRLR